jgi:hypothetical protein
MKEEFTLKSVEAEELDKEKVEQPKEKEEKAVEEKKIPEMSVEDDLLSDESKFETTDKSLELMRQVLHEIPDYLVFASTAMYLHGKEKGIEELVVPPGDLDIAVGSRRSLDRMRERLANVPGIKFDNQGKFQRFPGEDARKLSGEIPIEMKVDGKDTVVNVPFEAFYRSNIVTKDIMRHQEKVRGLNILNLEGLQRQYLANVLVESKVKQSTDKLVDKLTNPFFESTLRKQLDNVTSGKQAEPEHWVSELLQQLDLTTEELQEFYQEKDKFEKSAIKDPAAKAEYDKKITGLLAGRKAKLPKRIKNIEQLKAAGKIEI